MKVLAGGVLAAATLATGLSISSAPVNAAQVYRDTAASNALASRYPGEAYSQYRARRFYGGRGYGRGYYGGRGYGRGYGGAAAAGIAGLAAGALVAGAIASQAAPAPGYYGPGAPVGNVYGHDPSAVQYCAGRYRSYDPASGTFLGSNGVRYACP